MSTTRPHVLILGGGYVGLYTAWGLQKRLSDQPMKITLVEPNAYMTYQPLLPEVAGGQVDARNVTVQLRHALRKTELFRGRVEALDTKKKTATLVSLDGDESTVEYDHVVLAMGAVTRTFPTPGLKENGIGFKTLEEALYLRNQVLDNIARAAMTNDLEERAKVLSFVFIGGGYTGVEAIAELYDLALIALKSYPNLNPEDMKWLVVEALGRVAAEVGPELSDWTLKHLVNRGIDVRLETTMKSCIDGNVVLSDDDEIPADTIVWTAGMKPSPTLDSTDVPRGPKGHASANAKLQVIRDDESVVEGVWAAGDNAQVPNLTAEKQPAYYPPNAQNALRQAKHLAENIVAQMKGDEITEYRHESLGTLATYGVGKGAGMVGPVKLKGFAAWAVARSYHVFAMPTLSRKFRILAGWFVDAFTPRDLTPTSKTEHPRKLFVDSMTAQDQ